jgi:hypothetical protein
MPRLFEQSENTNPNTAQRVAFGRAANATENMTIANLVTYLVTNFPDAAEGVQGLLALATQSTVNTGTDDTEAVTSLKLQTKLDAELAGLPIVQQINIGVWDMDATTSINVDLSSLSLDYSKIRLVNVFIEDDLLGNPESLLGQTDSGQGGTFTLNSSSDLITLVRVTSGRFDNANYNDGVANRGTISILSVA